MAKSNSQNARLLVYLRSHKRGITQLEAFNALGVCRLSQRIIELESGRWGWCSSQWPHEGENIVRTRERVKGRFGVATVTRYRLA